MYPVVRSMKPVAIGHSWVLYQFKINKKKQNADSADYLDYRRYKS